MTDGTALLEKERLAEKSIPQEFSHAFGEWLDREITPHLSIARDNLPSNGDQIGIVDSIKQIQDLIQNIKTSQATLVQSERHAGKYYDLKFTPGSINGKKNTESTLPPSLAPDFFEAVRDLFVNYTFSFGMADVFIEKAKREKDDALGRQGKMLKQESMEIKRVLSPLVTAHTVTIATDGRGQTTLQAA